MSPRPTDPDARHGLAGVLYALAAFGTWGIVAPIHFKLLDRVGPWEILGQRIVWATACVVPLIAVLGRSGELKAALAPRRDLAWLCLSALLIAANWLAYIWAVVSGNIVQASLGYFLNPLVSVALGIVFLGERLGPLQTLACGLALVAVLIMAASGHAFPWLALTLAFSFGFYGLIRKRVRVEPLVGFCVESLLLLPFAAAFVLALLATGRSAVFDADWTTLLLLAATGATTAAPLIWFAGAAQRLRLSTVGLLQYLAPSCLLLIGILVYGEPFTPAAALAFGLIWTGLALYSWEALRPARSAG